MFTPKAHIKWDAVWEMLDLHKPTERTQLVLRKPVFWSTAVTFDELRNGSVCKVFIYFCEKYVPGSLLKLKPEEHSTARLTVFARVEKLLERVNSWPADYLCKDEPLFDFLQRLNGLAPMADAGLAEDTVIPVQAQNLTKLADHFVIHRQADGAIAVMNWRGLDQRADIQERGRHQCRIEVPVGAQV